MKNFYYLLLFVFISVPVFSQDIYFPPLEGSEWETMDPMELNWCEEKIDSFYSFLEEGNSKAFILLKDGKIVLEKYFDGFQAEDTWHWASVGKSMMAALVGIAQQDNLLNINDPTSDHLGMGWTSAPADKEELITLRHHLTMTCGLDDATNTCTTPDCLHYLADAGTRWAYHNAVYYLLADVLENVSGKDFNQFFYDEMTATTGITGQWQNSGYAKILYTRPRDMARFGLLCLNNGYWGNNAIIEDPEYFHDMVNTSQDLNKSYGYYWWLNGEENYMFPNSQEVFPGSLVPIAPDDVYAGIGYGGQYLNIIPSMNMVFVRMGDFPAGPPHPTALNSDIWEYLNDMECAINSTKENQYTPVATYPNPVHDFLQIELPDNISEYSVHIYDAIGVKKIRLENVSKINVELLPEGTYYLTVKTGKDLFKNTFIKS